MRNKKIFMIVITVMILSSGWMGRLIDSRFSGDNSGMMVWLGLPFLLVLIARSITRNGWQGAGLHLTVKNYGLLYFISIFAMPIFLKFHDLQWFFSPGIEGILMILLMFSLGIILLKKQSKVV